MYSKMQCSVVQCRCVCSAVQIYVQCSVLVCCVSSSQRCWSVTPTDWLLNYLLTAGCKTISSPSARILSHFASIYWLQSASLHFSQGPLRKNKKSELVSTDYTQQALIFFKCLTSMPAGLFPWRSRDHTGVWNGIDWRALVKNLYMAKKRAYLLFFFLQKNRKRKIGSFRSFFLSSEF